MTQLVVIDVPYVVEPDAIFDRDGWQVWPVVEPRKFFFEPHATSFNPWSGAEEHLIHSDPGSNWGWYKDGDGGVSFRVKGKR